MIKEEGCGDPSGSRSLGDKSKVLSSPVFAYVSWQSSGAIQNNEVLNNLVGASINTVANCFYCSFDPVGSTIAGGRITLTKPTFFYYAGYDHEVDAIVVLTQTLNIVEQFKSCLDDGEKDHISMVFRKISADYEFAIDPEIMSRLQKTGCELHIFIEGGGADKGGADKTDKGQCAGQTGQE